MTRLILWVIDYDYLADQMIKRFDWWVELKENEGLVVLDIRVDKLDDIERNVI